jgi:hypothetical protein
MVVAQFQNDLLPGIWRYRHCHHAAHEFFPDKRAAITAAFIARFGIGFAIGAARLPWPGWLVGLAFGLLLSIPDAIITKAYAPIIGMGAIGGTIIGFLVSKFGR